MKEFIKRVYRIPSPSLHLAAKSNLERMNLALSEYDKSTVLNIGSGERFIGEESLRSNSIKIVKLDISLGSSIDVLADAHILPFRDDTFQGVVCQAVLEHTRHPQIIIEEMHRILQKSGMVYVEVPFLQGFHPSPTDYYRFTLEGINFLFSRFNRIDSGVCVGPSSALCWILREYLSGIFTGFSKDGLTRRFLDFLFGWFTLPIKFLDILYTKRPGAHIIAAGLYFLGRKE